MPWLLALSILCALIGVPALIIGYRTDPDKDEDIRYGGMLVGGVATVIAVLLFAWSCVAVVSTRNVGIVTSFGKPVGTLSNGLHLKLPWQHVPELNGTIRTDNQVGGFQDGKCNGGTAVRLANNSTACVDNTIRWRIVPSAGDTLFRDYQNDNNIRDSLVTRELNATLNAVFADYNPLSPQAADGPNLTDLSATVTDKLKAKISAQIEVQNVIISIVHFDQTTQDKINAYQAQIASTRIAEESQKTAQAQAEANRILASSVSGDPNVLVARCLELVNAGKPLPAGFQCWPGSGVPLSVPVK
ncbi:SPFH domain-containing protein [Nocardia sp. NPDC051833]|uniref:SPFH domain-containing protein n=1 Tax=Nocardia sp. NPDC051833 TaxID=3155674 RepID=UPI003442DDF6